MSLRDLVPWHARIAAKLVLSRLPAGYAFWHRLGLFSHGYMDVPAYAHEVFRTHYDRSPFARRQGGFVSLELGPGDSALSALVTAAHGASGHHLIDAGRFANADPALYRAGAAHLRSLGLSVPDLDGAGDLQAILDRCHARYGTDGLASLRALPDASVDFMWSQAVLEHVRRGVFADTMREMRRALRPDGVCSHRVDLKDHLGGGLNNLRLKSGLWEKEWMAKSGFYTNRLRFSEMIALFEAAGFAVEVVAVRRWEASPIARQALAPEFRGLTDDDLQVREFDVLLRRA